MTTDHVLNPPVESTAALLDRVMQMSSPATGAASPLHGRIIFDRGGWNGARFMQAARKQIQAVGGWAIQGSCDRDLARPYDPFPSIVIQLAEHLIAHDPAVLERYGQSLVSIAPQLTLAWTKHPQLSKLRPIRSGLVDYAFGRNPYGLRDFYEGRRRDGKIIADVLHFILDAASVHASVTGRPLVLGIDNVQDLTSQTLHLFRLLAQYAPGAPLVVVGVCGAAAADCPPILATVSSWPGWSRIDLSTDAADPQLSEHLERLSLPAQAGLPALLMAPISFDTATLQQLLPEDLQASAEALVAEYEQAGLLLRYTPDTAIVPARTRAALKAKLAAETLRDWHLRACAVESDPFAQAFHRRMVDDPAAGQYLRQALEQAWAVSDYDSAISHAGHALNIELPGLCVNRCLLLGLLHYEAQRHQAVEPLLKAAIAQETDPAEYAQAHRILGYALVFGPRAFDRGLQHLQIALEHYETQGQATDAAWVRNSIAFVLYNQHKSDEAIALEREALSRAHNLSHTDRFLLTILYLNLGRLHRQQSTAESVRHIRQALDDGRGEFDSFLLLLIYATVGDLYLSSGKLQEAFDAFAQGLTVLRDFDASAPPTRVHPLLSKLFTRQIGPLAHDAAVGGDVVKMLLAFNLALIAHQLGRPGQAAPYRAWVAHTLSRLGYSQYLPALEKAFATPQSQVPPGENPAEAQAAFTQALSVYRDKLRSWEVTDPAKQIVEALVAGQIVAWTSQQQPGAHCILLYDPRRADLHRQICKLTRRPASHGAAVALPEACDLFAGADPNYPGVVQEATLRSEWRHLYPSIDPIRTRVQVVSEADDDLFRIATAFAQETGVHLLQSLTFRVLGEGLADTPELVLKTFLETGCNLLVYNKLVVAKEHEAAAPENLLPLRPRLAGTIGFSGPMLNDPPSTQYISTASRTLKVSKEAIGLLQQCDGTMTVSELLATSSHSDDRRRQVCDFLRQMRQHNVIHFV